MNSFAFVSASTDDVLRVMAVGIEDDAVAIRLASKVDMCRILRKASMASDGL